MALACVAVCMLAALSKVTHVGLGCLCRPDCWQVHGNVDLARGTCMVAIAGHTGGLCVEVKFWQLLFWFVTVAAR